MLGFVISGHKKFLMFQNVLYEVWVVKCLNQGGQAILASSSSIPNGAHWSTLLIALKGLLLLHALALFYGYW